MRGHYNEPSYLRFSFFYRVTGLPLGNLADPVQFTADGGLRPAFASLAICYLRFALLIPSLDSFSERRNGPRQWHGPKP